MPTPEDHRKAAEGLSQEPDVVLPEVETDGAEGFKIGQISNSQVLDRVSTTLAPGTLRFEIPFQGNLSNWLIRTLFDSASRETLRPTHIDGLDSPTSAPVIHYDGDIRLYHAYARSMYGQRTGSYVIIDAPRGPERTPLIALVAEFLAISPCPMSSVPGFALRPVDERELLEISDRAVAVYGDVQSYQGVYGPEPTVLVCDGCLTIQDNNPVRFLEKVKLTL